MRLFFYEKRAKTEEKKNNCRHRLFGFGGRHLLDSDTTT